MPFRSRVASTTVSRDVPFRSHVTPPAMATRFPLPAKYFDPVRVSPSRRQEYKDLVHDRVHALLADEYRSDEQPTEWKFVRCIRDVDVFQRRFRGRSRQEVAAQEEFPDAVRAVERGNPSMLVTGTINGSMEDMLFGASATTQEEMMTGFSITSPPVDAALLSVVDRSTADDPLRSAELLWVLTKLPLLCPRDVCFLKATGVGRDGNGVPYGYMVLHSVEVSACPPFDYRQTKVLRAKMYFSFVFRELTPKTLHVRGRGIFDLAGGEMLKRVLPHATATVIGGLLRSASCGETKKLTLVASRYRVDRHRPQAPSKRSVCSMCIRANNRLRSGARLRPCAVCGVPICKNCRIKDRKLFLGTHQPWQAVTCCATCLQQARSIANVRLGAPEFTVVAEFYDKHRLTSESSSPDASAVAAVEAAVATTASYSIASSEASEARHAPLSSTYTDTPDRSYDARKLTSASSLPFDGSKTCSSEAVTTASTLGESCAAFDCDVSVSGTLSDLNSGDYRFNSSVFFNRDIELEEEPGVSVALLMEYAELGNLTDDTIPSSARGATDSYSANDRHDDDDGDDRSDERYPVDTDNISKSRVFNVEAPPRSHPTHRPNNMFEWMMELQSSVEEAYVTAKANEALMKKSMR
ncbi:unnamed protein product [Hyaloperonospora brassicae]|uniref:FYVE-type domain-containing protein n=1 Tax=Hyaloperonospora brassicae TaxID=162125 RepID=A0AAV0TZ47_HYABA|nr:unnamed protein product [Hyaloperonospora brassicae]